MRRASQDVLLRNQHSFLELSVRSENKKIQEYVNLVYQDLFSRVHTNQSKRELLAVYPYASQLAQELGLRGSAIDRTESISYERMAILFSIAREVQMHPEKRDNLKALLQSMYANEEMKPGGKPAEGADSSHVLASAIVGYLLQFAPERGVNHKRFLSGAYQDSVRGLAEGQNIPEERRELFAFSRMLHGYKTQRLTELAESKQFEDPEFPGRSLIVLDISSREAYYLIQKNYKWMKLAERNSDQIQEIFFGGVTAGYMKKDGTFDQTIIAFRDSELGTIEHERNHRDNDGFVCGLVGVSLEEGIVETKTQKRMLENGSLKEAVGLGPFRRNTRGHIYKGEMKLIRQLRDDGLQAPLEKRFHKLNLQTVQSFISSCLDTYGFEGLSAIYRAHPLYDKKYISQMHDMGLFTSDEALKVLKRQKRR